MVKSPHSSRKSPSGSANRPARTSAAGSPASIRPTCSDWASTSATCVEVEGKRRTVCRVLPTFKEHRGKEHLQIDGIVRENAGVGLERIGRGPPRRRVKPAEELVLVPQGGTPSSRDLKYIGSLLDGLPVTGRRPRAGDAVRQPPRRFPGQEHAPHGRGAVIVRHAAEGRKPASGQAAAAAAAALLRGHRRPEAAVGPRPRDRRVAAEVPGTVRAAGDRRAEGRAAATARRAAARR